MAQESATPRELGSVLPRLPGRVTLECWGPLKWAWGAERVQTPDGARQEQPFREGWSALGRSLTAVSPVQGRGRLSSNFFFFFFFSKWDKPKPEKEGIQLNIM